MGKRGITLVELLIALFIISALSGTIAFIFVSLLKTWDSQNKRFGARLESSIALDTLIHDLRETLSVTDAQNRTISIWFRDADLDGNQDSNEVVTFNWDGVSGSSLTRTQTISKMIANNISNFQLNYFDSNDIELPSPITLQSERDKIKLITITISSSKDAETLTFRSNAKLRNR